jgi:threonine dehydrogenase-like Zn-dependent dehydrogenase
LIPERREWARKAGVDFVLDGKDKDELVDRISALTKGRMADVVFEVTGNPDAILDEVKVLRRQGRLIILSSPRGKTLF